MPGKPIESERLVTATRDRVFRAFSDPAALAEWWGPAGFTNRFEEFDFQDEAERVRTVVLAANEENFDRLEAYLETSG